MSEQTPDSAASVGQDEEFAAPDAEPSMEDILASIRKIIADDADPLPLEGPGEEPAAEAPAIETPVDEAVVETASTPESFEPASPEPATDDELDLEALLGDLGADLEMDVPDAPIASAKTVPAVESPISIPMTEADASDDQVTLDVPVTVDGVADEMDQLMDELMGDLDVITDMDVAAASTLSEEALPVEANLADAVSAESVSVETTTDDDLDLVKSLMADLTDEDAVPAVDTLEIETIEVAELTVTDEAETTAIAGEDDLDALEGDILDSIMDMTLGDETAAFQDEESDTLDLSQIADAAEADAAAPQPTATADPEPKLEVTDTQKLERPMPSALRSDAILDDVTEKATMTAFAELNQVVEDQAVLSERGPRVGDLVQDALKPMLKEWLDENIQGIVERAVAKEVKRIAAGK